MKKKSLVSETILSHDRWFSQLSGALLESSVVGEGLWGLDNTSSLGFMAAVNVLPFAVHHHCSVWCVCVYFPLVHWQKGRVKEWRNHNNGRFWTTPSSLPHTWPQLTEVFVCSGVCLCPQWPPVPAVNHLLPALTANLNGHQVITHFQFAAADYCVWLSSVTADIADVTSSVIGFSGTSPPFIKHLRWETQS